MPSLVLTVFILQVFFHLVNTVGASAINEFLWTLYNHLPTSTSASVRRTSELRPEIVKLKREMNATSSQDQFAKWAKLRRAHDKCVTEYDDKTKNVKDFRATFDRVITGLRFACTNGLRFVLQFWFAKTPMFWVPVGWVPWYVEFLLAFPRAPRGSVSVQVWGIACATVVKVVGDALVAVWVFLTGGGEVEKGRGTGEEKMKMKIEVGGRREMREGKKEL